MKRYLALTIAGGLTVLVAIVILTATLTSLRPSLSADPANAEVAAEIIPTEPSPLENWQAEVEAINRQIEMDVQERENSWQTRIVQQKEILSQLDSQSQAQIMQLEAQIKEAQAQIEQASANLESLQAHAVALQQAIQSDNATFQNEIAAVTAAEAQLRQEVENATAQLNAAYEALAQRQAVAAANQGGGGGGGHHDDDDDDHDEHERHEDDDDDEHEGHEDDDD